MMLEYWNCLKNSTVFKIAVTALVSYILYLMAGFMVPILLAIGLAFALYPAVDVIAQVRMAHGMIQLSRVVAIILALIGFIIFVLITIGFIIFPLFDQMNEFLQKLPHITSNTKMNGLDTMLNNSNGIPLLPSNFDMLLNSIINWAMGFVSVMLRNLLQSSLDIVQNLFGLIVVPFLAFYFLKDWRVLRDMVINLFTYEAQPRAIKVIDEIGYTLSAYIRGLFKVSLISGFVITVGNAFLGIEFPLVLGFWAILAETIPVVGPLMGAVPAIFIAYGQNPALALDVALFYAVYYQLDANYILPKIMGKKIDLHPVLVIGSLMIGAKLFGIVGMIFSVPVAAVYRVLYKELWHAGEDKYGTQIETEDNNNEKF